MAIEQATRESEACCGPQTSCCAPSSVSSVTAARPEDLAQIEALLSAASLPLEGAADHIDDFMVVRGDAGLKGAICMEDYGNDVLLRSTVVADDARETGIGSILVKAFIERARERGKERIYLLTDTAPIFFERFGFLYLEGSHEMPESVKASKEFSLCRAIGADAMALDLTQPAMDDEQLKAEVRRKYAGVARSVASKEPSSCCGTPAAQKTQVTRDLYSGEKATCIPGAAIEASRGCGDPTSKVALKPGDVVLDLGSGGGVDVFLAAREVGDAGQVYGLDMTDEMLELARQQAADHGFGNVEFIKGEIENIPLPDESVDVVISNCVISLVSDKSAVFKEIFRVLKPGGQVSISDIVSTEPLIPELKKDLDLWLGCLGGALSLADYRGMMNGSGFDPVGIEKVRVYDLQGMLDGKKAEANESDDSHTAVLSSWNGELLSAAVTATRPAAA